MKNITTALRFLTAASLVIGGALWGCSPPDDVVDDLCEGVECSGYGECEVQEEEAVCICYEGYVAEGFECVELPECSERTCNNRGTPEETDSGCLCYCDDGYTGDRCQECADGYHREGGPSGGLGECVPDDDPCDPDPCDDDPCVNGRCNCIGGEAMCTCDEGYAGDICDHCDTDYHQLDDGGACLPCNMLRFSYDVAGAASVWLTGSFTGFTGWATNPGEGAIELSPAGGETWTVDTQIEPGGRHLYKFIVDGTDWHYDPNNPEREDDGYGSFNSVIDVCVFGGGSGGCGDVEQTDWRDVVMYFVMVDRFSDSDGERDMVAGATDGPADGPSGQYMGGDLPGVTDRMGYLDDLGVTAIWLSAPYDNRDIAGAAIDPGSDSNLYSGYHGYWPSPANVDYSDPDNPVPVPAVESRIGSADDLYSLVDTAHATTGANGGGIRVLFDYVMNHVDTESGLYGAHSGDGTDWFARDEDDNFVLCGPGNLWDDDFWGTRCAFTDYLAPFDFSEYVDARAWSIDDALWWALEFGIDGYRLDAIKHVPLTWLEELRIELTARIPGPWGERFYLVGETFAYDDAGLIRSFVDPETMLDGQFDFPFKARVCEAVFTEGGGLNHLSDWMDGNDLFYGDDAIMTTWIGNHDIPRAIHFASRQIGNCREGSSTGNGWNAAAFQQPADAAPYERLGVAFAIMMTGRGIPLIYYGDEIGLAGGGDPDNRRMMVFDDVSLNAHQIALRDRVSALASIRAENPALSRGSRTTHFVDQNRWIYTMGGCGDTPDVTVAINRADSNNTVDIPADSYTDLIHDEAHGGGSVDLSPRSFIVLRHEE